MNQFFTLENAFKIPFLLNSYFSIPADKIWDEKAIAGVNSPVIPKYRVGGFTEHTYTRSLSMVGELMGMAEYAFVSISQRVLNYPLRVRAHYGHPDFIDGYWARFRGGPSKATNRVHLNEDIFLGYGIFNRGEEIEYVEYLEQQKGRESAFETAHFFECKLAGGAAQQVRSEDLYRLNYCLPFFMRISLFFGSIAFYASNLIMTASINFYVYSIVFFAISGITYHALGLLDAVIAVPWLFQIGFVLAFPLYIELIITKGLVKGTVYWLLYLPFALIFYVFHLKTKAYYFGISLFSGNAEYRKTGRGFVLSRSNLLMIYRGYFKSHFSEGLKLLAALIIYFLITTDGFMTATIRTASILLVVFSWLFAPLVFNSFPFRENILSDIYSMNDWIAAGSYVPDNQSNEKEKPNTNVVNSTNIQEEFKNEKAEDEFPNPSEYVEIGLLSEAENRSVSFPEKATKKKKAKKLLYFKDASPEIPSQKKKKSSREESIGGGIVAPPKIELKYTPWTLWFYEDILGELKITNNMKEPNMFKWILIKLIYFVWDFAPFALMFIAPISWPAIVFILILIIYMISMLVAHRLIAAEYRRMCILLTFWGCFFLLGYYYYYSDATLVDVLVSLILFFVMVVAIETLIREIVFPLGRTVEIRF